jgi:hypothetical protein
MTYNKGLKDGAIVATVVWVTIFVITFITMFL